MNKRLFPSPPKAMGAKVPKNEFQAFDALATVVLTAPKSASTPVKKKTKRSKP